VRASRTRLRPACPPTKASKFGAALLLLSLATGCATTAGNSNPDDPFESFNRSVYRFNDTLDRYALKPVAQAYQKVVPEPLQLMVGSFFGNLDDLYTGANNLLQAKPKEALVDFSRFVLNSTLGFAGVADVATGIGMPKHDEDLGQTLGYWGVPSGPYLVIPLLGPSTVRDAPSRAADIFLSPIDLLYDKSVRVRNSTWALRLIHGRAALLEAEKVIQGAALDPYSLIRDGWLQRRRNAVYDGNPPEDFLEDDSGYGDDDFDYSGEESGYSREKDGSGEAPASGPKN
jgi:phospholipid-binding lipoprotein MlaA